MPVCLPAVGRCLAALVQTVVADDAGNPQAVIGEDAVAPPGLRLAMPRMVAPLPDFTHEGLGAFRATFIASR